MRKLAILIQSTILGPAAKRIDDLHSFTYVMAKVKNAVYSII